MSPTDLRSALGQGLPALFECSPAPGDGVRVRTPMTYPDGTVVDVFVLERDGSFTLTDFGETLGWLRMQAVNPRLTRKQTAMVQDVCQALDVRLRRSELVLRAGAAEELAETVARLAQAAVRVSDIWFTLRTGESGAAAQIGAWLADKDIDFESSVRREGGSGSTWTLDYRTRTESRTSLVFLLSTATRSAARRVSAHVASGWIDLSHLKAQSETAFVSLFDDTNDVWRGEDFRVLGELSEVAFWSRPDELERILRAA